MQEKATAIVAAENLGGLPLGDTIYLNDRTNSGTHFSPSTVRDPIRSAMRCPNG